MPIETDLSSSPPKPGEKRSIIPGGKTSRIREARPDAVLTGRYTKVVEKLKAAAAAEANNDEGQGAPTEAQRAGSDGVQHEPVSELTQGGAGKAENRAPKDDGEHVEGAEERGSAGADGDQKPEHQQDLSTQFSALARAEKRFREERKAQQEEYKRQVAELKELQELKRLAEKDKYGLLTHLGVDVEDWAKTMVGRKHSEPASRQENEELAAIKKEIQELREERQRQSEQAVYYAQRQRTISEIDTMLRSDPDKYELTNLRGGAEVVFATMEQHYYNTNELLDYETAANLAEKYFEKDAESYAKASKFRRRFASQDAPTEAPRASKSSGTKAEQQPRRVLNNAADRVSTSGLTKAQRRERAVAALKAGLQ